MKKSELLKIIDRQNSQLMLAAILLQKLENCWNEDGKLEPEYSESIILPELSQTAMKHYKEIIGVIQ